MAAYSLEKSLVTADRVPKLTRARAKAGHYLAVPTVETIRRRHAAQKGYWQPRDILISQFQNMADLQSPFKRDKDGLKAGGYQTGDGRTMFAIETFPFDVLTYAISSMDSKHPYVNAQAASLDQSEKQVQSTERFLQAVVDNKMDESMFLKSAVKYLMTSGWLCTLHAYDPGLKARGEFPYSIQILDPLSVYPALDSNHRPIYATIEKRVTGAQLIEDYSMFPGIAELVDDEPDETVLSESVIAERARVNNSLETSEFVIIRYIDDAFTWLGLDASGCSPTACAYNLTLKRFKEASAKGKYPGVLVGSDVDEYEGVMEHHQGAIPLQIGYCWPEARSTTTLAVNQNTLSGRYVGLPFLFSQYDNWKTMCQLLSTYHTVLINEADPQWVTDADSIEAKDLNATVIHVGPNENIKQLERQPVSVDVDKLMSHMQQSINQGTFAPAAYGARAGDTGRQQNSATDAGTIRLNTITTEVERMVKNTLTGIVTTMIHRGDEELVLAGNGTKYDGPYVSSYAIGDLATPPRLAVNLMAKRIWASPDVAAIAKSLQGIFPQEEILREVAGVPNPRRMIEQLRAEAVMQNQSVVQPYIELAALKAQTELADETIREQDKLEQIQSKGDLWKKKQEIARSLENLPEEILEANAEQKMQELQAKLLPPGASSPSQAPSSPQPPQPGQGPAGTSPMPMPSQPSGGLPPNMATSPMSNMSGPMMPPSSMPSLPPRMPNGPAPMPMAGMSLPPPGGNKSPMPTRPIGPPMPVMAPPRPGLPMGNRPPLPMPPRPMIPPPVGLPPRPMGQIAKAPGQAQQPIQPISRMMPPGGVGRPGVPSRLLGAQGLPAQPSPALAAANKSVAPPQLPAITTSAATAKHTANKTRRGKRGGK